MGRPIRKRYAHDGYAGLVRWSRSRVTGGKVGIYAAEQAGLDPEGGQWAIVCEEHSLILNCPTFEVAQYYAPRTDHWCEECQKLQAQRETIS